MKKTQWKDIFRLIQTTKGRFFSLFFIVLIGVAFFVGVSASAPIMAYSVEVYNRSLKLKDITVYSNYGFDEEDIQNISNIEHVAKAEGSKFVDVYATESVDIFVTRVHSFDENQEINRFVLRSGRLPQNEHEALAEHGTELIQGFPLGSEVTLSRPEDDLDDFLKVSKVTIVGTIDTPVYLNQTKENSTLSNQYLNTYLYVLEDAFCIDYDTEVNVKIDNIDREDFSDAYFTYDEQIANAIEEYSKTHKNHRYETIKKEAEEEYADGYKEYEDGKKEYEEEILDAQNKIADAEADIRNGEKEIQDAIKELEDGQQTLNEEAERGRNQVSEAYGQINAARDRIAEERKKLQEGLDALPQLKDGISQCEEGIKQLQNGVTEITQAKEGLAQIAEGLQIIQENKEKLNILLSTLNTLPVPDETPLENLAQLDESLKPYIEALPKEIVTFGDWKNYVSTQLTQLETQEQELLQQQSLIQNQLMEKQIDPNHLDEFIVQMNQQIKDLETQKQELQGQVETIEQGKKALDDASFEVERQYQIALEGSITLEKELEAAQKTIDDGWAEIERNKQKLVDARQELEEAKIEFEDAKSDGQKELDDAYADLMKARQDIDDLEEGKWTVLDRSLHYASQTYRETIGQMQAIANIFPVFFLFVAMLVCLTTMTRMIDEQRGQIGIYRALGFSSFQCSLKYLIYAFIATLGGDILGVIVGLFVFPPVIYNTWRMMYILPAFQLKIPWVLIIVVSILFAVLMLITTYLACRNDMKDVPSQLMRPKAPKLGKNILLEKIPFLWNRLSFTWKVTIRNLFRYKKRFVMTLIGVAGCTGLLLTGFGIRDSIKGIVDIQFNEICLIDGLVQVDDTISTNAMRSFKEQLQNRNDVERCVQIGSYTSKVTYDKRFEETASVYVYQNQEDLQQTYQLRTRIGHNPLVVNDDGVIINERLSENLKVSVGDSIWIESKNGIRKQIPISGITEMYVQHYVFLTDSCYQKYFGTRLQPSTFMVRLIKDENAKQAFQMDMMEEDVVDKIEFHDAILNSFQDMVKGLDIIVWVILLSSMSLAFVVLGNLTNVNISERLREIATLKVLGFRGGEVQKYIFKENNILTFLGSLLGIPFGIFLHRYIMSQVEMDYIIFARQVKPISIVYAIALTVVFGLFVNFGMRPKLVRIPMVESLKSVE